MKDTRIFAEKAGAFPETHWALVENARNAGRGQRDTLESLALLYWRPVYLYIRRRWRLPNEEAKDLTQTFFLRLLESRAIERADPERGKFSTFLRTCLENMLRNEYQASRAKKRGGDWTCVQLEAVEEMQFQQADGRTSSEAERVLDAESRRVALHGAIERLREILSFEGKEVQFRVFLEHEMPEGDAVPSYQDLARGHGLPVSTITNYLHRVRRRLRDVFLEMLQEGPLSMGRVS